MSHWMVPRNVTTGMGLLSPESRAMSLHTQAPVYVHTNIRYTAIFPKLLIMSDNIKFLARIERMKVGKGGDTHSSIG